MLRKILRKKLPGWRMFSGNKNEEPKGLFSFNANTNADTNKSNNNRRARRNTNQNRKRAGRAHLKNRIEFNKSGQNTNQNRKSDQKKNEEAQPKFKFLFSNVEDSAKGTEEY